jgi:hypothetical protein
LEKERKKFRFSKKVIAGLAAAALIVVGGSMVSVGKNGYRYSIYPTISKPNIGRYNTPTRIDIDTVEETYDMIQKKLGIPVIVMDYYPNEMLLKNIIVKQDAILMEFEYNGERIYLKEAKPEYKIMLKTEASDRNEVSTCYNKWLNLELSIKENVLDSDRKEHSVSINTTEGYYLLEGIMDLEEFYAIVSNLIYK